MTGHLRLKVVVMVLLSCKAAIVAQSNVMQAHQKVSDLLKLGEVSRVSIIHVPSDLETRTRIDQQGLRRLTRIELSFTKPGEEGIIEPLQAALQELKMGKPSPPHEVRWGILLFDRSGKERAALFLDPSGKFIQIDGSCLQVQGRTLAWLRKSIHHAFR